MNKFGYYKSRGIMSTLEKNSSGQEVLNVTSFRREVCTADFDSLLHVGEYTFIVDPEDKSITEKLTGTKVALHEPSKFKSFSLFVAATYRDLVQMDISRLQYAVSVRNVTLALNEELIAVTTLIS